MTSLLSANPSSNYLSRSAGYGLASGNHTFFLGALYLFFINAFFIALSSFLVFKVLKVPPHGNIAEAHFRKQRLVLVTLGLLITIPSIYLAHQTVKDALQEVQVKSFIQTDMQFEKTSVVSYALKDFCVFDGRAADRTRRAFAAVDAEVVLVLPFFAVTADKVTDRRAAVFQSFLEDSDDGFMEADRFFFVTLSLWRIGRIPARNRASST